MTELSLNILDIAQNSITAGSTLTVIYIDNSAINNYMVIKLSDNGHGMTEIQAQAAQNPFYTTRTTRDVGLGLPLFKMAAEQTGGHFAVTSKEGCGTAVTAVFNPSSIDMMPLGDMAETMVTLISMNPDRDFIYNYNTDKGSFRLDTREVREQLGDVPLDNYDVQIWLREYITENMNELNAIKSKKG